MTAANIEALAAALYKGECAYTGRDHEGYCVSQTVVALRSFEEEIECLTSGIKILRDGLGAIAKKAIKDLDPIYEYMAIDALADADVVSGKQG